MDIPAVSMPIARSFKTCDICGIVLCDKNTHFRVAFYCGHPKAHLCNNHATPVRWMNYLGKAEVLTNTDLHRFGGGGGGQRSLRTTAPEHPFIQTQWKI